VGAKSLGVGELIWLGIAGVPFYLYGMSPLPTFVLVVLGSLTAYRGEPMPRAKQLMIPGFVVGVGGTALTAFVSRQVGYLYLVRAIEMLWWSGWFALFLAPLIVGAVVTVRGGKRS
jgi:hypothetical protein